MSLIYVTIILVFLGSCHPFYKRLTRGNWEKHIVLVKFPDLPAKMQDTLHKYFEARFTADTLDDVSDLISFDDNKQFTDIAYYDAYSNKFRLPFGRYFKIGKKNYFIYYSDLRAPLIFDDGYLYFPSKEYFDKSIEHKLYKQHEKWPYDKKYYFKYKL